MKRGKLSNKILNRMQHGPYSNNQTGYKGVYFENWSKKYRAEIGYRNRKLRLGRFRDPAVAAYVYNAKAKELYGDNAYINKDL